MICCSLVRRDLSLCSLVICRPALYGALLPCMRSEEDLVVRLAAANALKVAVDDFEFSVDQFLPYLETVFVLLLQILKVCCPKMFPNCHSSMWQSYWAIILYPCQSTLATIDNGLFWFGLSAGSRFTVCLVVVPWGCCCKNVNCVMLHSVQLYVIKRFDDEAGSGCI